MVALPAIFSPSPEAAAAILADLDDCSLSFTDLARKHGTSTEALALWLTTDEIKDRIQTTLDGMALRVRRVATGCIPAATRAICCLVDASRVTPLSQRNLDRNSPTYLRDSHRELRRDESIRRACALLLRLANFFSPTRPRRSTEVAEGQSPWRPLRDDEGSVPNPGPRVAVVTTAVPGFSRPHATSPLNGAQPSPSAQPNPGTAVPGSPSAPARHAARASSGTTHQGTNNSSTTNSLSDPSAPSAFSARTSSAASATALADPSPPPAATYERPRQRFKVRR